MHLSTKSFTLCYILTVLSLCKFCFGENKISKSSSEHRYATTQILNLYDRQLVLSEFNKIRSKVVPPAANMQLLEWDQNLADVAFGWVTNCSYDHPAKHILSDREIGSLQVEIDMLSARIISVELNKLKKYYERFPDHCSWSDQNCKNYVQLILANSNRAGCAVTEGCKSDEIELFLSCFFSQRAQDLLNPYIAGTSCSLCYKTEANWCSQNQCARTQLCHYSFPKITCYCSLECEPCQILNHTECLCTGEPCILPSVSRGNKITSSRWQYLTTVSAIVTIFPIWLKANLWILTYV